MGLEPCRRYQPVPARPGRNEQADTVLVSPISVFEIAQPVRLGKWLEMASFVEQLPNLLHQQGG